MAVLIKRIGVVVIAMRITKSAVKTVVLYSDWCPDRALYRCRAHGRVYYENDGLIHGARSVNDTMTTMAGFAVNASMYSLEIKSRDWSQGVIHLRSLALSRYA